MRFLSFLFGTIGSRRRRFVHNFLIHPLVAVLPSRIGTRLHEANALWAFGVEQAAESPVIPNLNWEPILAADGKTVKSYFASDANGNMAHYDLYYYEDIAHAVKASVINKNVVIKISHATVDSEKEENTRAWCEKMVYFLSMLPE